MVASLSLKWDAQLKKTDAYKVYYVNIKTVGRNLQIVCCLKRGNSKPLNPLFGSAIGAKILDRVEVARLQCGNLGTFMDVC